MLGSKQTFQPDHTVYTGPSTHGINWKRALQGGMIAAAFVFVAAVVCGLI